MPCNCKGPEIGMTDKSVWGPQLWGILHGLAEYTTKIASPLFEAEEKRTWILFLKSVEGMLPCEDCRGHYKLYIQTNPVDGLQNAADFREAVRRWIYTLHESVNQRLGKQGITFEEISRLYEKINIGSKIKDLEKTEKNAIQLVIVKLQSWTNFLKYARTLGSLYGVY